MSPSPSPACRELVELVTAYLDDALTTGDRIRVENHLAACDDCTGYLAQMRAVIALVGRTLDAGSGTAPELPAGMLGDLLAEFRRRPSTP